MILCSCRHLPPPPPILRGSGFGFPRTVRFTTSETGDHHPLADAVFFPPEQMRLPLILLHDVVAGAGQVRPSRTQPPGFDLGDSVRDGRTLQLPTNENEIHHYMKNSSSCSVMGEGAEVMIFYF